MIDDVLAVRGLTVTYRRQRDLVDGAINVNLRVGRGECVGLIGESGAGKSSVIKAIFGQAPVAKGSVEILGRDLAEVGRRERGRLRAGLQFIPQNPYASLNPRWRVGSIVAEPLVVAKLRRRLAHEISRSEEVSRYLKLVGLPADKAMAFPRQLSGGERQRVAIARALVTQPAVVIADEPVTALDNTTTAQVVELLQRLRAELDLTLVLISHSMPFVEALAGRVAVMHDGRVVETGETKTVMEHPEHPYTARLIHACRVIEGKDALRSKRNGLVGGGEDSHASD